MLKSVRAGDFGKKIKRLGQWWCGFEANAAKEATACCILDRRSRMLKQLGLTVKDLEE
jgi:hypothetical protein